MAQSQLQDPDQKDEIARIEDQLLPDIIA